MVLLILMPVGGGLIVAGIQLFDVSMGDFDSLLLSGAAQLDGTLNVSLLNNFMCFVWCIST